MRKIYKSRQICSVELLQCAHHQCSSANKESRESVRSMTERVLWITGLSASGKTTLGNRITECLRESRTNVIFLDGDDLRSVLGETLTHSRVDRLRLAFIYGRLCRLLSEQGMIVVIATVALFEEIHHWNRMHIPGYFEIFLNVPLSELRRRDPKGIYRRYDSGIINNVAGLDMHVDFPTKPDIHFPFDPELGIDQMADLVLALAFSES